MLPDSQRKLEQELDVIQRFSDSYRRQFAALIRTLNGPPVPGGSTQGLRLCVEAVNMMLESHHTLATALREISHRVETHRVAT